MDLGFTYRDSNRRALSGTGHAVSPTQIADLLHSPTETLRREIKNWLDLSKDEHRAKVARTLIALRNTGGGLLLFGFDDKSCLPLEAGRPKQMRKAFHPDLCQGLIKEYALPPFEVTVYFGEREGSEFPIVEVPAGVTSPVITRKEFKGELRQNVVYMRSATNGRVESTEPRSREDWDALMRVCFDNREADIARFFQRHINRISEVIRAQPSSESPTSAVLREGNQHFLARMDYLHSKKVIPGLNWHGGADVAVVVDGALRAIKQQDLLQELFNHHPNLSGWPMWVDSRNLDVFKQPYPYMKGFEASPITDLLGRAAKPIILFWRIDPKGCLFHRRSYDDDVLAQAKDFSGSMIDFPLAIMRATEALATALAFARVMVETPDDATMQVAYLWTNLRDRELGAWSSTFTGFRLKSAKCYEEQIQSEITVPLATPQSSLSPYVESAIRPLLAAFDSDFPEEVVRSWAEKTLQGQSGW